MMQVHAFLSILMIIASEKFFLRGKIVVFPTDKVGVDLILIPNDFSYTVE